MSQGSMDRGMGGGMGGGQWSGGGGWAGQQSNFGGQQGGFRAGGGYTGSPMVRRRRLGWSAIKLWWSAGWIPGWRRLHRLPKGQEEEVGLVSNQTLVVSRVDSG